MVKELHLFGGLVALVDDEDYDRVMSRRWHPWRGRNTCYVISRTTRRHPWVKLHQFILGSVGIDHKNGDGLDNRRCNLRKANASQNAANRRKTRGTSRFKGVYWRKKDRCWAAIITLNYRGRSLGRYDSELEAAKAYDEAARQAFGEFARLNFPAGDGPAACQDIAAVQLVSEERLAYQACEKAYRYLLRAFRALEKARRQLKAVGRRIRKHEEQHQEAHA